MLHSYFKSPGRTDIRTRGKDHQRLIPVEVRVLRTKLEWPPGSGRGGGISGLRWHARSHAPPLPAYRNVAHPSPCGCGAVPWNDFLFVRFWRLIPLICLLHVGLQLHDTCGDDELIERHLFRLISATRRAVSIPGGSGPPLLGEL